MAFPYHCNCKNNFFEDTKICSKLWMSEVEEILLPFQDPIHSTSSSNNTHLTPSQNNSRKDAKIVG